MAKHQQEQTPGRLAPGLKLGLLATAACLVAMLHSVLLHPATRLVGTIDSEASSHLRRLAGSVANIGQIGPFLHLVHPAESKIEFLAAPISAMLTAPFALLDPGGSAGFILGWNTMHALALCGSAWGAWLWVRAWLGEEDQGRWAAGTAMGLAAASLHLAAYPEIGRLESLFYPLYALHGGLLFQAARHGGWRWAAAAASSLPLVWSGGYGAVFFVALEPAVCLWALRIAPSKQRALAGMGVTAMVALDGAVAMGLALKAHPPMTLAMGHRAGSTSIPLETFFGLTGAFLERSPPCELLPWAGWAVTLAALAAPALRRSALIPLVLALWGMALAAGPEPQLGSWELYGPAWLLSWGPLEELRVWHRMFGMVIPLLVVGGAALALRRPWVALLLLAGALGENALRKSWPVPSFSLGPAPSTGVVLLPMDEPAMARRWLVGPYELDPWLLVTTNRFCELFKHYVPNTPLHFERNPRVMPSGSMLAQMRNAAWGLRSLGAASIELRDEPWVAGERAHAEMVLDTALCAGARVGEARWMLPETGVFTCPGEEVGTQEADTSEAPKNPHAPR